MTYLSTIEVPVTGDAEAGSWVRRDARILRLPQDEIIHAVPDPRFSAYHHYALRVRDSSMNRIIRDGEFAVCVALPSGWRWNEGDVVVVECRQDGGRLLETTLKQISTTDNWVYLWPRSDDPRFQEPIKLGDEHEFTIDIVALVVSKYAPMPIVEPAPPWGRGVENQAASPQAERPCDRLKRSRIRAGFRTAKEFAEKHGIPQPTYHQHETGGRSFMRLVERYAEALGVTPQWLHYGDPLLPATVATQESTPAAQPSTNVIPFKSLQNVRIVRDGGAE